jgi:hypothetical protein
MEEVTKMDGLLTNKQCTLCQNCKPKKPFGTGIMCIEADATTKNFLNDCTHFKPVVRIIEHTDGSYLYDLNANIYPYEFSSKYGLYYCVEILNGEYKGQKKLIITNSSADCLELDSGFYGNIRLREEVNYIVFIDNGHVDVNKLNEGV